MPGGSLREKVISIICEEWANPDNEVRRSGASGTIYVPSATIYERLRSGASGTIYVPSATIYERLRSGASASEAGIEVSQHEVDLELQHLASHGDITLVFEPSQEAGGTPTIADVSSELCA